MSTAKEQTLTGRFLVWLIEKHPTWAIIFSGAMRSEAGDKVMRAAQAQLDKQ